MEFAVTVTLITKRAWLSGNLLFSDKILGKVLASLAGVPGPVKSHVINPLRFPDTLLQRVWLVWWWFLFHFISFP